MAISQARSRRSPTGSRYVPFRKKTLHETGREPTLTKVGEDKKKTLRVAGANRKYVVRQTTKVNVVDKKANKAFVATITSVKENPANPNYIRRNIITKGCTVETDKGDVMVTSRPGQDGTVNGYLL